MTGFLMIMCIAALVWWVRDRRARKSITLKKRDRWWE
jgi:hypothetical protein